jgi:CheY-like chemotaxis protein
MACSNISAKRILVVDDEPMVCDSVRMMLAAEGHVVETAPSGKAALDVFQSGRFDLILVDYAMPSMKGDVLAAAIKALDRKQPVAIMTGYLESQVSSGNPPITVDLVLGKPFSLQELRQALTKLWPRP